MNDQYLPPDLQWKAYRDGVEHAIEQSIIDQHVTLAKAEARREALEEVHRKYEAIKKTPGYVNLTTVWRQLDEDGIIIGVSRQALEETISHLESLTK